MTLEVHNIKHALIFGANGGIGHAISKELLEKSNEVTVHLHHKRAEHPDHLLELKQQFGKRAQLYSTELSSHHLKELSTTLINENIKLDLLVNTIGFLHDEIRSPEKSLRDIDEEHFAKSFFVNATLTALIAQHFLPLFDRKREGAFVSISAKVGSISDNRMGGWYSYRASKAALNMILKNISIELQRKKSLTKVLSIHPGTTDTYLSKPFTKNTPYKLHQPIESARNILNVIFSNDSRSGSFYSWDGSELPF